MRILLIGSGGREHALARLLVESSCHPQVWVLPGNPGMWQCAERAPLDDWSNHQAVCDFCLEYGIDLVVIGPEAPLAAGLTDALRLREIPVFGPSQAAARLESSKWYAKRFADRYDIPTARWVSFTADQVDDARQYVASQPLPLVIKADGLAAGKGVLIATSSEEAYRALELMFHGEFGQAGKRVVIEEFLHGEEASLFAICDGERYLLLSSAQDHKRIYDGDRGPNTGGMGAYAPAPVITDALKREIEYCIIAPTIQGMLTENAPFVGCLYVSVMISDGKPYVIEYNARFGDPETQSVLEVFRGDFARLIYSAARGKLDATALTTPAQGWSCTVVLASKGYPAKYQTGFRIKGIEQAENIARVYHAGTALDTAGHLITAGGRVLNLTSHATSLPDAVERCYMAAQCIYFEGIYYRRDIAARALRTYHLWGE